MVTPASIARCWGHTSEATANAGTWSSSDSRVGAKHADTGSKLRPSERYHVLADMGGNNILVMGTGVSQNPLDQVVAILIACDIYERDARTIDATFADAIKVSIKELSSSDLQALLNYLGGILIRTVLSSIFDDVINSPTSITGSTMLANVLNTPIAKLAVRNNVDVHKNFLNAWTLTMG